MRNFLPLLLVIVLLFAGCERPAQDSELDAAWERHVQVQMDTWDRQAKRTDEAQDRAEEQDRRFDALLAKWEEQAGRYDAILTAMELRQGRGK